MSKGVGFSWRMAVRFCVPFEIAKRKGTMGSRGPNRSPLFSIWALAASLAEAVIGRSIRWAAHPTAQAALKRRGLALSTMQGCRLALTMCRHVPSHLAPTPTRNPPANEASSHMPKPAPPPGPVEQGWQKAIDKSPSVPVGPQVPISGADCAMSALPPIAGRAARARAKSQLSARS